MNIFFLFGQAAWIPETKADKESSETNLIRSNSVSYGTFVGSNDCRDNFDRDSRRDDLENVISGSECVASIARRRSL